MTLLVSEASLKNKEHCFQCWPEHGCQPGLQLKASGSGWQVCADSRALWPRHGLNRPIRRIHPDADRVGELVPTSTGQEEMPHSSCRPSQTSASGSWLSAKGSAVLLPGQECLTHGDPDATRPSRAAYSFGSGFFLMFLLTEGRADLQISASHTQSSGSLLVIQRERDLALC